MDTVWAITGVVLVLLIAAVKFLVPRMMDASSANVRFAIGVVLFAIYTVVTILVCYYFCTFDADGTPVVLVEEFFIRMGIAFFVVNMLTVFTACLYHISREKRKLSHLEKMKLKDM